MKSPRRPVYGMTLARALPLRWLLILLTSVPASAGTIYVNAGGTPPGTGTSWPTAYTSLDVALAAAAAGDEIWVAEGTYKPGAAWALTHGFWITKQIKLYGGFKVGETLATRTGTREATLLDGNLGLPNDIFDNSRHVITVTNPTSAAVVIDRFTIQNGTGLTPTGQGQTDGAGIHAYCVNLNLSDSLVRNNSAENGGGLWMMGGCFYDGGPLGGGGDGPQVEAPSRRLWVKNCDFELNLADNLGGGIYGEIIRGEVVATTFRENEASSQGAGVYLRNMRAGERLNFTNCVYYKNLCQSFGAGLRLDEVAGVGASASIVNCTFASNQSTTAIAGDALSVSAASTGIVNNSILFHNGFLGDPPIHGSPTVAYSDVEGGFGGTNNINVDPRFRNLGTGNLRLRNDTVVSDCIDRANYGTAPNNLVLPQDLTDVDNDGNATEAIDVDLDLGSRTVDITTVPDTGAGDVTYLDMGAYERGG